MTPEQRKTIIYSAMSIDGFISTSDGGVEWLDDFDPPENEDYGYTALDNSLDTTIMGRKTYEKVLSFKIPWPYADKVNYVCSKNPAWKDNKDVVFKADPITLVNKLKSSPGKHIWIVGGGALNTILLANDLVDEMILSIIPVVLGSGIKQFNTMDMIKKFKLTKSESFSNGVILLHYQRL